MFELSHRVSRSYEHWLHDRNDDENRTNAHKRNYCEIHCYSLKCNVASNISYYQLQIKVEIILR